MSFAMERLFQFYCGEFYPGRHKTRAWFVFQTIFEKVKIEHRKINIILLAFNAVYKFKCLGG